MNDYVSKLASIIRDCDNSDEAISKFIFAYRYVKDDEEDLLKMFKIIASHNPQYAVQIYIEYMDSFQSERNFVSDYFVELAERRALNCRSQKRNTDDKRYGRFVALTIIAALVASEDNMIQPDPFYALLEDVGSDEQLCVHFIEKCRNILSYIGNAKIAFYTVKLLDNIDEVLDLKLPLKILSKYPITVPGGYHEDVIEYVQSKLNGNDYQSLQYLLRLFPQITSTELGCDPLSLLDKVKGMSPELSIPGIISAGILAERDETEEGFVDALQGTDADDEQYKNFITVYSGLYSVLKDLKDTTPRYDFLIDGFLIYLEDIELEVFRKLLIDAPDKVLPYLKCIENVNAFGLKKHRNRLLELSPRQAVMHSAELNRLASYYDDNDLAYIYLNSNLKLYVPVQELFRIFYDRAAVKKDRVMSFTGLFRFTGKIRRKGTEVFVTTEDFRSSDPDICILNEAMVSNFKQNTTVTFAIGYSDITDGFDIVAVIVHRDDLRTRVVKKYIRALSNEAKYHNGRNMSVPVDLFLYPDEMITIGIKMIDIMTGITDNRLRAEFIMNVSRNPFAYGSTQEFLSADDNYSDEVINKCRRFMEVIIDDSVSYEDTILIYMNSLLKMVIDLDEFLYELYPGESHVALEDDFKKMFRGTLIGDTGEQLLIEPFSMHLAGGNFLTCNKSSGSVKRSLKIGQIVMFKVTDYYPVRREYTLSNVQEFRTKVRDMSDYYYVAMNKAGLTTDIDRKDRIVLAGEAVEDYMTSELAYAEVCAIAIRLNDYDGLMSFVKMISSTNPWRAGASGPIAAFDDDAVKKVEETLIRLVDRYQVSDVLYIYFNTSLKSADHLKMLILELKKRHKNKKELASAFAEYGVNIDEIDLADGKPRKTLSFYEMGNDSMYNNTDLPRAVECFKKAIECNDHVRASCHSLVNVLVKMGELDEAERIITSYYDNKVISLNDYLTGRLRLLYERRDPDTYEEITGIIEQARKLTDPAQKAKVIIVGCSILMCIDRPEEALELLLPCERMIKEKTTKNKFKILAQCYKNIIRAYIVLDRMDEAREYCEYLHDISPKNSFIKVITESDDTEAIRQYYSEQMRTSYWSL